MKKLSYLIGLVVLVGLAVTLILWPVSPSVSTQPGLAQQSENGQPGSEKFRADGKPDGTQSIRQNSGNNLHASPFELGPANTETSLNMPNNQASNSLVELPEKEEISPREAARRKQMEQLGYMVPPEYYTKDLKTLRKMAKAGDAFAMVHIGEKYAFELNGQKDNPEFDPSMNYPDAAKQSFKQALVAGNIRSAGIISELYFNENNALEAYAWHIVSEQMGDSISADWFRLNDMSKNASPQLKTTAAARALQIVAELDLLRKK
ncbi:sel1 repeat family protein [Undibacterium parvum]|uniref:Sel1 repeat family protein n=2 Tax=Undibacterium TaxID=401469 RepID=A0A6M4A5G6_9BURK|nr:sel1 repeat family protein [Undibacterium parvum]AZP12321.1 sel1 repeat family protein [Undibacterium parvum]QJQ06602.1 sel1 repeat family protein [Undibacterium piscinae]